MLRCANLVTLVLVTSAAQILGSEIPLHMVLKDLIVALNVQNSESSFGVLSIASDIETSTLLLLLKDVDVQAVRPIVKTLAPSDSLQFLDQRVLLLVLPEKEALSNDTLVTVEKLIQEESRKAIFILNTRNQIPEEWFHELSIGITMKVFVVLSHHRNLEVVEWYRVRTVGDLHRTVIAEKSSDKSWTFNLKVDDIWSRRTNMEGYPVKITSVTKISTDVHKMRTLGYHIYFAAVWWLLASALNISTTIYDYNMTEVGVNVNGCWTGLMGEMVRGRADVFVTSVPLAIERVSIIDITEEVFHARFRVWVRRPQARPSWWSLALVFHARLWAVQVAAALGVPLVLYAAARGARLAGLEHCAPSLAACFVVLIGCFCNQGWSGWMPRSGPLRLLALVSLWLGLLSAAAYGSSLVAHLTAPHAQLPFHSLDEMVDVGTHTLLVYKHTLPHRVIVSARNGSLARVARFLASRPDGVHTDDVAAMRRMCAGGAAMLDIREFLIGATPCLVAAATPTLFIARGGLAIRKGHPLLGAINNGIRKAREGGLLNNLKRTYFPTENSDADFVDNFRAIELEHVIAVFLFFGLCIAISVLVLLTERAVSKVLHKTEG